MLHKIIPLIFLSGLLLTGLVFSSKGSNVNDSTPAPGPYSSGTMQVTINAPLVSSGFPGVPNCYGCYASVDGLTGCPSGLNCYDVIIEVADISGITCTANPNPYPKTFTNVLRAGQAPDQYTIPIAKDMKAKITVTVTDKWCGACNQCGFGGKPGRAVWTIYMTRAPNTSSASSILDVIQINPTAKTC